MSGLNAKETPTTRHATLLGARLAFMPPNMRLETDLRTARNTRGPRLLSLRIIRPPYRRLTERPPTVLDERRWVCDMKVGKD
jgi:hypothetical protein